MRKSEIQTINSSPKLEEDSTYFDSGEGVAPDSVTNDGENRGPTLLHLVKHICSNNQGKFLVACHSFPP